MSVAANPDQLRDEWLSRLSDLIADVQSWADELGWATRRIEIAMEDSQIGRYKAPALLLQDEAVRIILEPLGRSAPGADGVVDLYLMPAYDDIARLYFHKDRWHVLFHESPNSKFKRKARSKLLTSKTLAGILDEMKRHAHEI